MKIVGLDLSLSLTGAVSIDTALGRVVPRRCKTGSLRGGERMDRILEFVVDMVRDADLAVIEGPSFMSKSASKNLIYEMHGLVKHTLWRRRVPYAIATPAQLKIYATGSGKSEKNDVIKAMRSAFPKVEIADDNVADAFVLATMGCRWKNQVVDAHVLRWPTTLDKVEWPDPSGQAERKPRTHKPPVPRHRL